MAKPDEPRPQAPALPTELSERIRAQLGTLYDAEMAAAVYTQLSERLNRFSTTTPPRASPKDRRLPLSAADAMVITYGDQVRVADQPPLETLHDWLRKHLGDVVTSVHILPFYPYSSDDGFSVIDYLAVDVALGAWDDVERLGRDYRLMFDAVINHISAQSAWFQGFLQGEPRYADYFIVMDEPVDLSGVTRPRTHPVLTTFETASGAHRVWTTFSEDQIDLNYANPEVLLAVVDVLLAYVTHGAAFIRLDAIGYLWKSPGTACIHLPETHTAVQLIRSILDAVAADVLLITETNVPHRDNISYYGDGYNEAQLVYQFPLAPLVLNAFQAGSARHLTAWAKTLPAPSGATTFFNFLASHDGIGVMPASGILSPEEIDALVRTTLEHGGRVSYKTNPDGTQSPYELNITLFDALSNPADTDEGEKIDRFMAAQAIMLALAGLPGIYIHSLVGSSNDLNGLSATGRARSINRQKWERDEIEACLADPQSRTSIVLRRYLHLLRRRARTAAFDPSAAQEVLAGSDAIFALRRTAPGGTPSVVCLHNLAPRAQTFDLHLDGDKGSAVTLRDLISDTETQVDENGSTRITLPPYGVAWLAVEGHF